MRENIEWSLVEWLDVLWVCIDSIVVPVEGFHERLIKTPMHEINIFLRNPVLNKNLAAKVLVNQTSTTQ